MNTTKTHIIVAGGAGYIGSHVCKALAAAGCVPVTVDNLSAGHRHAVKWGPLVECSLGDQSALSAAFERYDPAAVILLAGSIQVGESGRLPLQYYRNNVIEALALFEVMAQRACGRIVFSSTAAVYGTPDAVPIPEDARCEPVNVYGRTKQMIELALSDIASAHGWRYAALRYFNAAGADPEHEIGEEHEPETHLIPLAIRAALGRGGPLSVFGSDYPTADGTCVRDYVHVSDLAEAHVLAVTALLEGRALPTAMNLGTGRGASVREVLNAVGRAVGREVPVLEASRRDGDPAALVADPTLARRSLGWSPRLATLDEIVATAVEFERSRAAPVR